MGHSNRPKKSQTSHASQAVAVPDGHFQVTPPQTLADLPAQVRSHVQTAPRSVLIAAIVLVVLLIGSYLNAIALLTRLWWKNPDYVHGFLVIPFAAYLLWIRRDMLRNVPWAGSWWGLMPLAIAALMQGVGAYAYFDLPGPASILPCMAGLALLVGGWKVLHWAWPAIIFLGFMVPLPAVLSSQLSAPLQRVGTIAGTYVVQTVGIPAVSQGNRIILPSTELGVAEACNGLRMMMLFVAVCTAVAFCMRRSLLEKAIVVASAIPIAIVANVARIVVTAILYELAGQAWGDKLFHDLAGWFMMPLAVVLLWIELELMARIVIESPAGPLAPRVASLTPAGAK